MNSLKTISTIALLVLCSCSPKPKHLSIQNEFTSGLDQMKPSKKNEVQASDFLSYADKENFKLLLKEKRASFVVFGLVSNDYSEFEKKYGIKVKTENCVITPGISKIAALNNKIISNYLNDQFKDEWKDALKITPFGLQ